MEGSSFERLIAGDGRLRAFNDTVPAGILVLRVEDGKVLFANRFFREVLGAEGGSVIGENWVLGDRVGQAIARAERERSGFAVLFVDLDGFKQVNDRFGHAAGDAVLKRVAQQMLSCVRAADTVARIGGDEFVVVVDKVSEEMAVRIAERIVGQVSRPQSLAQGTARVGASAGIALYSRHGRRASRRCSRPPTARCTGSRAGGVSSRKRSGPNTARLNGRTGERRGDRRAHRRGKRAARAISQVKGQGERHRARGARPAAA